MLDSDLVCDGHDDFTEGTQTLVDGLSLLQPSPLRA